MENPKMEIVESRIGAVEDALKGYSMRMTWAIGIICTIFVAAIPWTYSVHAEVAAIRAKLDNLAPAPWFVQRVEALEKEVEKQEDRIRQLERR